MLKIDRIEVYKSPIKLKKPFVISLGKFSHAENIIVVIKTNDGHIGFGECSPFMPINGESIDTCFVVAKYLANALIGKNPLDIEKCSVLMEQTIYGNSSIKSAFDIALYDIASQNNNLPLYKYLGGKNNKELITDYTVSIGSAENMASDAVEIIDNGFRIIKVKLGGDYRTDLERIKKIRAAIGFETPLRLDANQGWDPVSASNILSNLEHFNIQFCEEPIARWNYMALAGISHKSKIMVMADESCCDHHDADRLINLNSCKSFNIKLGKSAGIFNAMKIVELAEKSGIELQVGGFLESRLGFTASAHLALASDNILFCDFDTPLMFSEDPVSDGIKYSENGKIIIPEIPGLGASVDKGYLEKLTRFVIDK